MPRAFLKAREPFSSYSHFIGAVLSGAGLFVLLVRLLFDSSVTGSLAAAAVVFCLSLIALYSASSVYHFSGRGDEFRRALRIDTPVGAQQSQNHAVGPAFAGKADLIGHLAEFTVGIAEIPAPRTNHHAEPDARNTARQPDRRSRRGRAALPRRGAQFDARDPVPGRHGARFDGVGAKFGRHKTKIGFPAVKCKPRPVTAAPPSRTSARGRRRPAPARCRRSSKAPT